MIITSFPEVKEKCEAMLKDMREGSGGHRFVYAVLLDWAQAQEEKDK